MASSAPPPPSGGEKAPDRPGFGITLSKKAAPPQRRKVATQETEEVAKAELITGMDESGEIKSLNPSNAKGPLVIPLIDNTNPQAHYPRKPKDLPLPSAAEDGETAPEVAEMKLKAPAFESADTPPAEAEGEKKYGLQIMQGSAAPKNAYASPESQPPRPRPAVPLLMRNIRPELEGITDEKERLKADVDLRPEEASADRYEDIPVEQYGEALLRGMGWEPGKPIGLNNTKYEGGRAFFLHGRVVVPIEYVPRHHRLGLGAQPKAPEVKQKKHIKPGESREPRQMMMVPTGPDGRQRHYRTLDEQLVPFKIPTLEKGSPVAFVGGLHEGMTGRIVSVDGPNLSVRLASDELVNVPRDEVTLLNASNMSRDHFALQGAEETSDNEQEVPKKPSRDANGGENGSRKVPAPKEEKPSASDKPRASKDRTWMRQHLVVRIISKNLGGGTHYQKKGRIVDVVTLDQCTVQLDDQRKTLLESVSERHLQTVVPNAGGVVMILNGPQAGQRAKVIEKGSDDVVVQNLTDLQFSKMSKDDVCQFDQSHATDDMYD